MTPTWLMSIDISIESKYHGENIEIGSFQPTQWLSAVYSYSQCWLKAPSLCVFTDMSQVGVALFSLFNQFFLSFHLPRFSFYINIFYFTFQEISSDTIFAVIYSLLIEKEVCDCRIFQISFHVFVCAIPPEISSI